jgi:hypothetical protein
MEPRIPQFVWFVSLGVEIALIVALVEAARRFAARRSGRAALSAAAVLVAWLGAVLAMAAAGLFRGSPDRPPPIGLAIVLPVAVGMLALRLWPAARAFVSRVPGHWLVGVQVLRTVGLLFIILQGRDLLPAHFAQPAGWGDFAVGVTAPLVAYALARRRRGATTLAALWNAAGMLDLVVAVTLGALSAESSIQVFHGSPSTAVMAALPLSTIPTFGVPLFFLLHVASLRSLRGLAPSPSPSLPSQERAGRYQPQP